jgi:hypothetical protein
MPNRALKDRRDAFEAAFAHAQTQDFYAKNQETYRQGLWAARTLGMYEHAFESYARNLVQASVADPENVFTRIRADFAESGLPHSEEWLRRQLDQAAK